MKGKKAVDISDRATHPTVLLEGDFNDNVQKEKMVETTMRMIKQLSAGGDVTPVVIGKIGGKTICLEMNIDDNGNYVLPELKSVPEVDLKTKSKTVNRIVERITPVLRAQIDNVAYLALMRKDMDKLREILHEIDKEDLPIKVENRVGCIWLIIGQYEFVL